MAGRTRFRFGRAARVALAALAIVAAVLGGAYAWFRLRPPPSPVTRDVFEGVHYERRILQGQRPSVVHVVTIDVGTPGIGFFVTPGDPNQELPLKARTTSQFLREFKLQIAINGDFFTPWYSKGPLDYYPHAGDPVAVDGYAASDGVAYSKNDKSAMTLSIGADQRPSFTLPRHLARHAISGEVIIHEGDFSAVIQHGKGVEPRTAVAMNRDETKLYLLVIDGRQHRYSQGLYMHEMMGVLRRLDAYNAMNLDGGGSSVLVMEGEDGSSTIVSSPIHSRIPGRERPVANHLGVFAKRQTSGNRPLP